jgi:Domain of unknown function (DUF4838)
MQQGQLPMVATISRKLNIRCLLAWCGLLFVAGTVAQAAEQELATHGKTPFVIVTPARPLPEEVTAADWLATTLKQITGAPFAILAEDAAELPKTMLLVGDTRAARKLGIEATKLKPEEWRIKLAGESLVLAGGRPRGTVYAVCEFLEGQCGVLWLDPFTVVVPSQPTLTVPAIDRSGRPAFPLRMLYTGFPYGHPAGGGPLIEQYRIANKNNINGRVTSGDHARMIPAGVHTFGEFISSKEFAATHPEYFGMDASGRRLTDDMGTPSAWTQLCVTNDNVRRITLERAKRFLVNERDAAIKEGREPSRMLVLSQNDNTANLCLCPNCKAVADREGSESGPQLEFVNHVARGLKDEFPDVVVQTEAYNFTLAAPKTIRPEANVVVRFCDNYGFSDLTHPLAHPRNERPMKLFAGWQEKQCKLGVWDYWRVFNQHPPGFFAPSSNVRALCDDIRMFHKSGVELMTIEAEDLFGAGIVNDPISADMQSFMPLRIWIGMKLIDNPDKDLSSLLDTFCRGYYGPASKPMRALLERIEDRQTTLPIRIVDVQRHVWAEQLCDAAFFADAYLWLDEAMLATAADPFVQTNIQRERIIIDSAFLWLEEHVRLRDPARASSFPKRADVLQRHRADWHAYLATVFDADGLKLALPIIDAGISLAERIHPIDTLFEHVALGINESDVKLDGHLSEPFWQHAKVSRMLPRDPEQPNDDPTSIRLAWTDEALYVGIEQPADKASATLGITLMGADRQGIQLSLYAPKNNGPQVLNPYFYDYDPNGGLRIVSGRQSQSQSVGAITDVKVTTELRFLWSDIAVSITPNAAGNAKRDFVFNIESYLKPDSKVPSHVSSPWLVGTQPNWHSGYYRSLRLANPQAD